MTLDEFFAGRDASHSIFDALAAAVAERDDCALQVSKSQVAFCNGNGLAFVWTWT